MRTLSARRPNSLALRYLLHRLPYAKKDLAAIGAVDPLIVGRPSLVPSVGDDQLASGTGCTGLIEAQRLTAGHRVPSARRQPNLSERLTCFCANAGPQAT